MLNLKLFHDLPHAQVLFITNKSVLLPLAIIYISKNQNVGAHWTIEFKALLALKIQSHHSSNITQVLEIWVVLGIRYDGMGVFHYFETLLPSTYSTKWTKTFIHLLTKFKP
jgi:hypothetical protein